MIEEQAPEFQRPESQENFVAELVRRYVIPTGHYMWPREEARWQELVFCLLVHLGDPDVPPETARNVTEMLTELGLLGVEELASLVSKGGSPDLDDPALVLVSRILERVGYESAKAEQVVVSLCELAGSLVAHHGGKVQRYLRLYGQRMLDEVGEHFPLSRLRDVDARYVFTHWLQNVLSMPVGLSTPEVQTYCSSHDVDVDELMAAADAQDLNLAVLDDLIAEYMSEVS